MGTEGTLNLEDFIKKYWWRVEDAKVKIPKAIDAWFADPKTGDEAKIAEAIKRYNTERLTKCEQTVFAQRKRVADAERTLATKVTKKAQEDMRIGTAKVEENLGWIADIKRAEFKPRGLDTMYVACLWSHWEEGGESLDSFAAITDEPPPEVAAAGHDRCIIPIKEENAGSWLYPEAKNLGAMQAILEDRARPYYEYRMAA